MMFQTTGCSTTRLQLIRYKSPCKLRRSRLACFSVARKSPISMAFAEALAFFIWIPLIAAIAMSSKHTGTVNALAATYGVLGSASIRQMKIAKLESTYRHPAILSHPVTRSYSIKPTTHLARIRLIAVIAIKVTTFI
ncbi:unnamed protein product [Cercospora beticola]|nr:unnamed protein product [Cercospora beticola]